MSRFCKQCFSPNNGKTLVNIPERSDIPFFICLAITFNLSLTKICKKQSFNNGITSCKRHKVFRTFWYLAKIEKKDTISKS